MTLKEYIENKFCYHNYSQIKSKQQVLLTRINAIFNSLDMFDTVTTGKCPRHEIVCNTGGLLPCEYWADIELCQNQAMKLHTVFAFIVHNYYIPNHHLIQQSKEKILDKRFAAFIEESLSDIVDIEYAIRTKAEFFNNRVRIGDDFEEYLKNVDKNPSSLIVYLQYMSECKSKVSNLFKNFKSCEYNLEERSNEINNVYSHIFDFCEKIRPDHKTNNLLYKYDPWGSYLYPITIDTTEPYDNLAPYEISIDENDSEPLSFCDFQEDLFESILYYANKAKELYPSRDLIDFCNDFIYIIQAYKDVLYGISDGFMNNITESDINLFDFLLDDFGIGNGTGDKAKKLSEYCISTYMKSDHWEKFCLKHREKLWELIESLIEEYPVDTEDPSITKDYSPLYKYLILPSGDIDDIVKEKLHDIKLKLYHPEIYRVFKPLKQLYCLYDDINNAPNIKLVIESKKLSEYAEDFSNIVTAHLDVDKLSDIPDDDIVK